MGDSFFYDVMIDKVDFCNRQADIQALTDLVDQGKKIVIYAPRRYGKSSLVKNVIGQNFQEKKNQLCIYVNLMEVQSLENISERVLDALREVLKEKSPIKSMVNEIIQAFEGMVVSVGVDPQTNLPSVDNKPVFEQNKKSISQAFGVIKNLSKKYKLFLILDEFQDIGGIPQAARLLRGELQTMKTMPIALLGSKLEIQDIAQCIEKIVLNKASTYRFQEGLFSEKEKLLLKYISRQNYLTKPTENRVVTETKTSSGSLSKMLSRLTQKGWIEYEGVKGYRISDPLFSYFLKIQS